MYAHSLRLGQRLWGLIVIPSRTGPHDRRCSQHRVSCFARRCNFRRLVGAACAWCLLAFFKAEQYPERCRQRVTMLGGCRVCGGNTGAVENSKVTFGVYFSTPEPDSLFGCYTKRRHARGSTKVKVIRTQGCFAEERSCFHGHGACVKLSTHN